MHRPRPHCAPVRDESLGAHGRDQVSRTPRQRWLVRVDPEINRDLDLHDACDMRARFAYMDSLFYLASGDGPSGLYPAYEMTREFGREAEKVAAQLLAFGIWRDAGLGFYVAPYAGCGVVPEYRLPIPPAVRFAVYSRDGWRCVHCGSTKRLTLDHIYPWSRGGPDTEDNLQTLCRSCNSRKGARV